MRERVKSFKQFLIENKNNHLIEVIPNKYVYHTSNPGFREKISEEGLVVKGKGATWLSDTNIDGEVIFAVNSDDPEDWWDSTYDDDIYKIDTTNLNNKWYNDPNFDLEDKRIITFENIPLDSIELKYEGTGLDPQSIYDADWNKLLPQEMIILKDGEHAFKLGNIMKHSDMVQVTYENANNEWGVPSTLQFDFHFSEVIEELIPEDIMRIDIDVTWGEAMACEFYIDNTGKVEVIEYTSFNSKTDPSNTIFALDDNSLKSFVEFLNRFGLFNFDVTKFKFLDKSGDYLPN